MRIDSSARERGEQESCFVFIGAEPNVVLSGEPFHFAADGTSGAADHAQGNHSVGIAELSGDIEVGSDGDVQRLRQECADGVAIGCYEQLFRAVVQCERTASRHGNGAVEHRERLKCNPQIYRCGKGARQREEGFDERNGAFQLRGGGRSVGCDRRSFGSGA